MNCPKCGSILAPGTAFCPVCNEPIAAAYPQQGYAQQSYPQQGYPQDYIQQGMPQQNPYAGQAMPAQGAPAQQNPYAGQSAPAQQNPYAAQGAPAQPPVYQQSYAQYGQPQSFMQGYQQPYSYDQAPTRREENTLLNVLSELPRAFLDCFTKPGTVLTTRLARRDSLTCPIVAVLVLVLTFLSGMVIVRGFIGALFMGYTTLTRVNIAGSAASMNQGINYIAGRIAPSVGGIAALCQLLAMLVPALVMMVTLIVLCKTRFSWELLFGFITVLSLPTAAFSLLAMLASLLTPWLAVLVLLCGAAVSHVQMGALLGCVTGQTDAQLMPAKLLCIVISLLVTLVLCGLVGGLLMNVVVQRVMILLTNVGSLI
ncbi:MAG: hypothetical protein RR946_08325 [Clostridia bacterium]